MHNNKKRRKLLLLVAHHKEDLLLNIISRYFDSIQVGAELSDKLFDGILHDNDAKDNISIKNKRYCELTACYYAYKNIKAEYYGLMHYRRLFTHRKNALSEIKSNIKYIIRWLLFLLQYYKNISIVSNYKYIEFDVKNLDKIEKTIAEFKRYIYSQINNSSYDIFVPQKVKFGFLNMEEQFVLNHNRDDWEIFKKVVMSEYPELKPALLKTINQRQFYAFNMFIMKREYFEEYMEMLFNVLGKVEEKVCFSDKDNYQERLLGFLAERFFNIYINYLVERDGGVRIKELNTVFIKDV